ncbi:AraC family transcriptional regulator [Microbacterium sp. BWT-B31]|uniref:helix-turn-helix transcriptional regulator n=1 Tax=Microbacterium sp. BWT-B31 TaxID=3232072 RepID=UPI003529545B
MIVSSGVASHSPTTEFRRFDDFPFWTAGVVLRGSTRYRSRGLTHIATAPSLQIVPPGTAYQLSCGPSAGPWVEAWAVFAPPTHWTRLLALPEPLPGIRSATVPRTPAGHMILREVVRGVRQAAASPRWRNEIVASTVERVLLLAQLQRRSSGDSTTSSTDERLRAVEIAIFADPGRQWTVSALAGISHLSPSRFAHLFTQQRGISPMRYLEAARMERARELLLSTADSVQEIAHAVGYSSPLHFSARFKVVTSMAPTEFRRHPRE